MTTSMSVAGMSPRGGVKSLANSHTAERDRAGTCARADLQAAAFVTPTRRGLTALSTPRLQLALTGPPGGQGWERGERRQSCSTERHADTAARQVGTDPRRHGGGGRDGV